MDRKLELSFEEFKTEHEILLSDMYRYMIYYYNKTEKELKEKLKSTCSDFNALIGASFIDESIANIGFPISSINFNKSIQFSCSMEKTIDDLISKTRDIFYKVYDLEYERRFNLIYERLRLFYDFENNKLIEDYRNTKYLDGSMVVIGYHLSELKNEYCEHLIDTIKKLHCLV